jgi:uncharacterized protein with PIN domain
MNGRRRLEVRFWEPQTDATLWVDTADIVVSNQRERLVARLPVDCRSEGEDQLLDLANHVAEHRQRNGPPIPSDSPATPQPTGVYSLEQREQDWTLSQELATEPRILDRFADELVRSGVVGEARAAKLVYLAVTSRLLHRPVSVAVKGPSSGGKSFTVERTLDFFPPEAYISRTAMSEKALAYSDEPLSHRMLVIYEAAGMAGDFQSYLIRSLLSEGRIVYETVERGEDGLKPRRIEREGPTGLIVTTTAVSLHPENETRMLSVTVTDTPEQTRAILTALAATWKAKADLEPWRALQRWIQSAEHYVEIPFAIRLTSLIPPVAVRLRRDVGTLLSLIRSHALLHQANRDRTKEGAVLAIVEDYAVVRELIADLVAEGIGATVPMTVRETVAAVGKHTGPGGEVTVATVAKELELDKSSALRRVRTAIDRGYLKNLETGRGRPAKLTLGDALPQELTILPDPAKLEGCMLAVPQEEANVQSLGSGVPLEDEVGDAWEPAA